MMATPIRQLRGTTAEITALPATAFASGVLIVEEKEDGGRAIRVTDGVTPGGVSLVDFSVFRTVADFAGNAIPLNVLRVEVQGFYAQYDGGGGQWRRVANEPAHAAKVRSRDRFLPNRTISAANGGWWEPADVDEVDIRRCGAKADWQVATQTGTNNAPFIQAAADLSKAAANAQGRAGGCIVIPTGSFGVAATVVLPEAMRVAGAGRGRSYICRAGNFGDTFSFAPDGYARQIEVRGVEFQHSIGYDRATNGNLPSKATSGAHLKIRGALRAIIEDCSFSRLPYQIHMIGGDNILIRNNLFYGVWDEQNTANQEGIAQIFVDTENAPGLTAPTNWDVENNYFAGQASNERSLTWPGTAISRTYNRSIGSQFGLLMRGCENGRFSGNHFGGLAVAELAFLSSANTPLLDIRVSDNFFDGSSHGVGILVQPTSSAGAHSGLNVRVTGNVFIDQRNGLVVRLNAAGTPSVYGLHVTDNKFRNMIGAPVWISGAKGYSVCENEIGSYNRLNLSTSDASFCAGVLTDSQAAVGEVARNRIGGGVFYEGTPAVSATYPNSQGTYTWDDIVNAGAGENYNYDNNTLLCARRKAAVVPPGTRS